MDRVSRGFASGVIAGILMNAVNLIFFYIFKLTQIRFVDWASIVLFGHRPENFNQLLLNLVFNLLWDGFFGVIFAVMIPKITSRIYLFKGVVYGVFLTFVFRAIATLFGLPFLTNKFPILTHEINTLTVAVWGFSLAYGLKILDKKPLSEQNQKEYTRRYRVIPAPARKVEETKEKKKKVRKS